jgi:hypothetical protein
VERGEGGHDLVALERREELAVEVVGVRLDADRSELADQVATAGQRDVAFVAQAARDDRDRAEELSLGGQRGVQMCTTGQVSVRVIPSSVWTLATTSLPSSSTLRASARTITS